MVILAAVALILCFIVSRLQFCKPAVSAAGMTLPGTMAVRAMCSLHASSGTVMTWRLPRKAMRIVARNPVSRAGLSEFFATAKRVAAMSDFREGELVLRDEPLARAVVGLALAPPLVFHLVALEVGLVLDNLDERHLYSLQRDKSAIYQICDTEH